MGKRILLFLCVLLTMTVFLHPQRACAIEDMGEYYYWYSDESSMGYWQINPKKVYINSNGSGSGMGSNIYQYTYNGMGRWSSEGTFSLVSNASSADIGIVSIDGTERAALGLPYGTDAVTFVTDKSLMGYAYYHGNRKSVYAFSKAYIFLVYDSYTSGFSNEKWRAITTHEFGHALGYAGHDNTSTATNPSLMNPYSYNYWDTWGVASPTTRDLHHMGNN